MAYFANGTEGEIFESRWCSRCVHNDINNVCPVMMLHFVFNDIQVDAANRVDAGKPIGNDASATALLMLGELIREDDGRPAQCAMFFAAPD